MANATARARVYIGAYTHHDPEARGEADGISLCELDAETGALTLRGVTTTVNPSFLALHPNGRTLYAVNETTTTDGAPGGAVSAFDVEPATGALTFLNCQPSRGDDPCHLSLDATGRLLFVANYTSGSLAAYPLDVDGRIGAATDVRQHQGAGPDPERQAGPHAHCVLPDPSNRFALAADLGLDQALVYRLDHVAGGLTPHEPPSVALPPGSGPRHLAFHPALPVVYIINELASTVSVCAWDADSGTLTLRQTVSTLPEGFTGTNSCAEIVVAPSGRFVYGSNRGHDSVATFAVDPERGTLAPAGHVPSGGVSPRNIVIDRAGRLLLAACQGSNRIVAFRLDPDGGVPMSTGETFDTPSPVCLRIVEG